MPNWFQGCIIAQDITVDVGAYCKRQNWRRGRSGNEARVCLGKAGYIMSIDGFQMSIKYPTFRGQTRDQEAAVQQTFRFEVSSFFYPLVLMVST